LRLNHCTSDQNAMMAPLKNQQAASMTLPHFAQKIMTI
jgi:hypothetical protein